MREDKRRSDSRYRTVIEQAGDGIFLPMPKQDD
jgi:hypothetical protein